MSIKTIMVPVDGSEPSQRALAFAITLAGPLDAELELVTVMDLGQLDFFDGMSETLNQLDDWQDKLQREVLQPALDSIPDGGPRAKTLILRGAVHKSLMGHITSTSPCMVVMGRTGRTAMNRILHGSVSRRISGASPVPVTLVG